MTNENINKQISDFTNSVQAKFSQMGGWTRDHQLMLNSFLQERFLMANVVKSSNETIKKTKAISDKRLEELRKSKEERESMAIIMKSMQDMMPGFMELADKEKNSAMSGQLKLILSNMSSFSVGELHRGEPMKRLDDMVLDSRVQSMIR